MNINLKELEEDKKKNSEERMKFVEFWANYIRTHLDEKWSEHQNVLIDSQIQHARALVNKGSEIKNRRD